MIFLSIIGPLCSSSQGVIHLNVGGEMFLTSKATLCFERWSGLAKMVRGEKEQLFDKDGNLFIDQDPKYFPYILQYLRTKGGIISVPEASLNDINGLAHRLGLVINFTVLK